MASLGLTFHPEGRRLDRTPVATLAGAGEVHVGLFLLGLARLWSIPTCQPRPGLCRAFQDRPFRSW